jgi:hypothetical protein
MAVNLHTNDKDFSCSELSKSFYETVNKIKSDYVSIDHYTEQIIDINIHKLLDDNEDNLSYNLKILKKILMHYQNIDIDNNKKIYLRIKNKIFENIPHFELITNMIKISFLFEMKSFFKYEIIESNLCTMCKKIKLSLSTELSKKISVNENYTDLSCNDLILNDRLFNIKLFSKMNKINKVFLVSTDLLDYIHFLKINPNEVNFLKNKMINEFENIFSCFLNVYNKNEIPYILKSKLEPFYNDLLKHYQQNNEDTKIHIINLMDDIKETTIENIISNTTITCKSSQEKMIEKINNINLLFFNKNNKAYLYQQMNIENISFFEMFYKLSFINIFYIVNSVSELEFLEDFLDIDLLNGIYIPSKNTIVMSRHFLDPQIFKNSYQDYSITGIIIAHEIMHAIDSDRIYQYLSAPDTKKFKHIIDSYTTSYGKYDISEDFADINGITLSLKTLIKKLFKDYKNIDKSDIESFYSYPKMTRILIKDPKNKKILKDFFYTYAAFWKNNINIDKDDKHSSFPFRINKCLSNIELFYLIFPEIDNVKDIHTFL